jgi:hypothetical protein
MTPSDFDDILSRAGDASAVDPAVVERAKRSILGSLQPVRPLPPSWMIAAALLAVLVAVSILGAASRGAYGVRKLSGLDRAAIFTALGVAACFAAIASAREMRPAGGRRIGGWVLAIATAGMIVIFALLFQSYGMQDFVKQGVPCLVAGLLFAMAASAGILLILRRGYVLNMAAAGLAAGTLAGLAGLTVLELHCPNLRAIHVMVWHVAVVLLSGVAGYFIGRFWPERGAV